MNLTNLTIGAAALGLLALTAPTLAAPLAAKAHSGLSASDIAKARYQNYPSSRSGKQATYKQAAYKQPLKGRSSYASESRGSEKRSLSGRAIRSERYGKIINSGRMDGRGYQQGRSVSSPRGIAPYSDIPHKAMRGGASKAHPLSGR
jgi:hypothetical protein